MKKLNWNTDRIVGLSAMLISLLTLIIFIYQTNVIRKQSQLSVTPRLEFFEERTIIDSIFYFKIHLVNKGTGPAIVESLNIIYNGKIVEPRFREFLESTFPKIKQIGSIPSSTYLPEGATISANESINLFIISIPTSKTEEFLQYINYSETDPPVDLEVIYSSIYQEKWTVNNQNGFGHPIKQ